MADREMTAEQTIEVTIGLWDKDVPPGKNPPALAAAILDALEAEGYDVVPSIYWLWDGPHSWWRWPIWLADELLDRVPTYEDGRWFRRGGWGCRMRLHRWWVDKSEWETARTDASDPSTS